MYACVCNIILYIGGGLGQGRRNESTCYRRPRRRRRRPRLVAGAFLVFFLVFWAARATGHATASPVPSTSVVVYSLTSSAAREDVITYICTKFPPHANTNYYDQFLLLLFRFNVLLSAAVRWFLLLYYIIMRIPRTYNIYYNFITPPFLHIIYR